ncbi:hypothetical protein K4U91_11590, partial [Staphylococcus epidermidis]|uniref:hypothetical protein n=1 Tax=Mammaliicoccus sciuri TaxID=1296 RepID=UPI00289B3DDA
KPTIRQVLGLLRVPRLNVNKAIGIKQRKELKKMSEKTKKSIRIGLSFAQVVVQSLIVYYAYKEYKLTKEM